MDLTATKEDLSESFEAILEKFGSPLILAQFF